MSKPKIAFICVHNSCRSQIAEAFGKVLAADVAELLGTPGEYGRITTELSGAIFKDPAADPTDPEAGWQMADEYLSGDVRAKLRMAQLAAENHPEFKVNVDALTKAQPKDLEASEIDVRLGATWLAPEIIQKFMTETFQIPYYLRHAVKVRYEVKRGKHTSVKGARQKRFIRFRTLGAGYSEDEIKAVLEGKAKHQPYQKQPPKEQPFHLLVDIQAKLSEGKGEGYARWAKRYNLKEMSKTLIFLQEKKIGSVAEMQERVNAATARYHELGDSIKAAETRMAEIAVLRTHIVNYAKTRPVYDAYRKAGYSKRFLENHRAEITLHKAAKAAFDESNLKTLPKVKELDAEYSKLLTEKKALYPDYRKAKDEMQELLRAQRNVELFFAEEKNTTEKTQSR